MSLALLARSRRSVNTIRTQSRVTASSAVVMLASAQAEATRAMKDGDGPGLFGVLLHQYRTAAGLSQDELAELAGLSRLGISNLERGERRLPHPATVRC